jgi:cation diffusion facilitator family transporter
MLLVFSGIFIIYESINRYFRNEFLIFSFIGIFASLLSIIGKFILYRVLLSISIKVSSPGIHADAHNYRMDIITSFGVLIAIIFSYFEFYVLDPLIALIISLLIFKTAWSILRESVRVILDEAPEGLDELVHEILEPMPEVLDVHNLRIRNLGSKIVADCHVRVKSHLSVDEAHRIMHKVEQAVYKKTDISELLIHIEPEDQPC